MGPGGRGQHRLPPRARRRRRRRGAARRADRRLQGAVREPVHRRRARLRRRRDRAAAHAAGADRRARDGADEARAAPAAQARQHPALDGSPGVRPAQRGLTPLMVQASARVRGDGRRRFGEDLGVAVDVGLGRRRRHERHVVERRQQDAAVQRLEVDAAGRGRCRCRRRPRLPVRGRSARKRYSTRQPSRVTCHGRPCTFDRRLDALLEALAERDHPGEGLRR